LCLVPGRLNRYAVTAAKPRRDCGGDTESQGERCQLRAGRCGVQPAPRPPHMEPACPVHTRCPSPLARPFLRALKRPRQGGVRSAPRVPVLPCRRRTRAWCLPRSLLMHGEKAPPRSRRTFKFVMFQRHFVAENLRVFLLF